MKTHWATACWPSSPASSTPCAAPSTSSAEWPTRNAERRAGPAHRVPHRHPCRRHHRRGRRHLRRRRQRGGPARRHWRSPAASACRRACRRTPRAGSMSASPTTASSSSRTSPGRCGSIACGSDRVDVRRNAADGAGDAGGLAVPDMPSIAVLPFQNMSGDPEQEYFADGMVEDIITALSRYRASCSSSPAIRPSPTRAAPST